MPPAQKRPRKYDPLRTRTAVLAQLGGVREAVEGLDSGQLALPTRREGMTVRELAGQVAASVVAVRQAVERPAQFKQTLPLAEWPLRRGVAFTPVPLDLAGAEDDLRALLADHPGSPLVDTGAGVLPLNEFLVTRAVELVLAADDLSDAVPGLEVPQDRHALAAATRLLADALAAKAPGGSTEVRVPPYAVVQCVEGLRHTRGTPPNVVETGPLTWVRLATGRLTWADALARAEVSASGERADLSGLLPLGG
ncbi:sterol carrier family protein [Streptomyces bauhiniae]|uniref:sterol carrier family protein n=1 Tax=Streptomyces bauhiniae TaxID=2340725 RepID=UPI00332543CA